MRRVRLSGIIDWGESAWKTFRAGLYRLDTLLGNMEPEGFSTVIRYEKSREQFFETVWGKCHVPGKRDSVRSAETVGVFIPTFDGLSTKIQ